jgi:23S rRNA (uracil-5-)-methyltransferase RumA
MQFKRGAFIDAIRIEEMANGGKGFGYIALPEGRIVVFVEQAIPGQMVKAQITKNRKRYMECRLVEVLERSPLEVTIPYQPIAGAPYITLPLHEQHRMKEKVALDVYERLGRISQVQSVYEGLIASPLPYNYRNRMDYSFSAIVNQPETGEGLDGFALGFKARGAWWKAEKLQKESGMFDAQLENGLHRVSDFCEATGLPPWHAPKRHGFFRFLIARKSFLQDALLLNLVTTSAGASDFDSNGFVNVCREVLGDRLAGIIHTISDSESDHGKLDEGQNRLLYGRDYLEESLHGLHFRISMQSFFQPNPKAAEKLYERVSDYVFRRRAYAASDVIMDLFCGTGTIGQILSTRAGGCRVIGVDIVEQAIDNARQNAQRNGLSGAEFYAADAGRFLLDHPELQGKIRTIVLDPPRAGVGDKTMEKVIALGADRIVYVSCNPATQSRDTQLLQERGYRMEALTLVDQFPHTAHIEAVALFERSAG